MGSLPTSSHALVAPWLALTGKDNVFVDYMDSTHFGITPSAWGGVLVIYRKLEVTANCNHVSENCGIRNSVIPTVLKKL